MNTKKEKNRPPKPGSKKAQVLKKETAAFIPPNVSYADSTIFLQFKSTTDLKLGLGRIHNYYERQILKGPLKGVNLPIQCLEKWLPTVQLTKEEELVVNIIKTKESLYLIASLAKDSSTLLHEWAHAVYFFKEEYREIVSKFWDELDQPTKSAITKELILRNYSQHSFIDEFQAYVRENPSDFGKKLTPNLLPIHLELKKWVNIPQFTAI